MNRTMAIVMIVGVLCCSVSVPTWAQLTIAENCPGQWVVTVQTANGGFQSQIGNAWESAVAVQHAQKDPKVRRQFEPRGCSKRAIITFVLGAITAAAAAL